MRLYNQIVEHMRKLVGADRSMNFPQLVAIASRRDPVIRKIALQLREYGNLRNAIVHHGGYPEEIVAEPNEKTVETFRRIVDGIMSPRTLIPAFRREIRCFDLEEKLVEALRHMRDHDFAQIVIRAGGRLGLLTVRGIARWLASHSDTVSINVDKVTLSQVMEFEAPDTFLVMRGNQTVNEAQQAFTEALDHRHRRLFAVIVTENGTDAEDPAGLVTPTDLLDSNFP